MPTKRLPSGRVVDEPDIDIGSPPIGDVEWLVWNKTKTKEGEKPKVKSKVVAHTFYEARQKGMTLLGCEPDEIEVEQAPQPPGVKAGKRRKKRKS